MNPTGKKKKTNQSVLAEIFGGIVGLFSHDATSFGKASGKITFALLFLIAGIAFLIRPVVELDGTEIKKEITPYVLGSVSILISIILVISWLRKRNSKV
jgi:hypothetical protein